MGNRLRLNEQIVRKAALKPGRDYQIFDNEIAGFAIRIYRSGNRAFTMDYRIHGRQRRYRIGPWPEWTVVAARDRAKELRREIDAEIDPHSARDLQRTAPTVSDMIDRYIEEHLPRLAPRSQADQISMMRKMVEPAWGSRLVTEITKRDVAQLLNEVAKGRARPHKKKPNNRARKLQGPKPTPIRANRLGQALRKMFNLAIEWEWRSDNPAQKFHQRTENSRERFLSLEEIERLAAALERAEDRRGAAIIRMCMLTGARVGEVRTARFDDFNLEFGSWSKPAATTKQRKIHRIPISAEVAQLVRQRRLMVPSGCPWLFPGDAPGQPVQEIRRFWVKMQKEARIEGVRIHDLRHTFASLLVSGGASLEMIGRLLGHTQTTTTQRYAHLMDTPLREGVNAVASIIGAGPKLVHSNEEKSRTA
ncbi:tyrosine-type recombinase/integrase [Roseovarius sp.]|uniref:tyrosine-type recombinase/integrase n=1 Tax=Roseovarius sp. TaxID=1486281 RepID=UPI0035624E9F